MEPLQITDEGILQERINYTVLNKETFDDTFAHIGDTSYAIAARQIKQSNTTTLGMVIYAEPHFYADKTKTILSQCHIPFVVNVETRSFITDLFRDYFLRVYSHELKQITFGHEHGEQDGKCHIQMCVEFNRAFRGTIKPSVVRFKVPEADPLYSDLQQMNSLNLLFMGQLARNTRALQQYCKKDGDFWYLKPDQAIKFIYKEKTDKNGNVEKIVQLYPTLAANRGNLSIDDAKDLVRSHDPRSFYLMGKNLDYQLEKDMCGTVPALIWTYPDHLKGTYPYIEKWFNTWCVPADLKRRKALLLYSPDRCMGKTEFALSLVNDLSYVVCFRNTFVQDNLKNKIPKLLVLDDMSVPDSKNKETWKALVAGQKTSIRDCHYNFAWDFEVPCIITTNNEFLVKMMFTSMEFNTQVVIQYVYDYMGPPGTKPQGLDVIEHDLPSELIDKFKKDRFEYEKRKEEEKLLGKKTNRLDI